MHAVLHVGRPRAGHSAVVVRVAALHRVHRVDRLRHLAVIEEARTGRAGAITRASGDRAANGRRGEAQAGSERGAGAAEPTIVTLQLSAARCEARVEQQRTLRPRGVVKGPGCHAAARGRRGERGVRRLDEALYGSAVAGVCAG